MNHQDVISPPKPSQPVDNDMDMVSPQEILQTDEQGPARKTLMLKSPKAPSMCWIELFFNQWCAPVGKP
jgi:hypothetical protein